MVTTKLNLSMTEPQVRQIYAKQGDTGRVLDITLDQTPEDGTLRILRPDGVEVTSEAVTGGEISESGETVSFESLTEVDVTELSVGIEPVQDLSHGDPSPSNICPITGHTQAMAWRTGKNLYEPTITEYKNESGASFNGFNITSLVTFLNTLPIGTYNASFKFNVLETVSGATSWGILLRNSVSGYIDGRQNGQHNSGETLSFTRSITITAENKGQFANAYLYSGGGNKAKVYWYDFQLELGSTATAYEPYQGSTYATSLGQTVYGGTLDMVSGVLTVTHGNIASYNGETLPSTWISDRDVYASGTTPTTGAQVVYELATPLTYTLTAHQIKTLVGTNNVWASSGQIVNITFTYGGLLSELPSDATSIVGKCYCDVEQNGVSSMPFTLNVKKNERES